MKYERQCLWWARQGAPTVLSERVQGKRTRHQTYGKRKMGVAL
jgi:hypothetical protein